MRSADKPIGVGVLEHSIAQVDDRERPVMIAEVDGHDDLATFQQIYALFPPAHSAKVVAGLCEPQVELRAHKNTWTPHAQMPMHREQCAADGHILEHCEALAVACSPSPSTL